MFSLTIGASNLIIEGHWAQVTSLTYWVAAMPERSLTIRIANSSRAILAWLFHANFRQAIEFCILALCLLTADPSDRSLAVGAVLAAAGAAARLVASGYRYSEDTFMVRGPYRFVRHPHHLGTILVVSGLVAAGQNAFAAIASMAAVAIFFRLEIIAEEKRLAKGWGPRYAIFRGAVSAIVPQLVPFVPAGGEGAKFSLKNCLVRNSYREPKFVAAVLAAFGSMAVANQFLDRSRYLIIIAGVMTAFLLFRGIYYGYAGKNRRSRGVVSIADIS